MIAAHLLLDADGMDSPPQAPDLDVALIEPCSGGVLVT